MPHWKLIATDVRLSHQLPAHEDFTANVYECTSCHNKINDRNGLPSVCPWCGGKMKGETNGQRNKMPRKQEGRR